MDLSRTLNELKDKISESNLGRIERNHQRLFHLGRELKSGGRSLSALGIGRFHNFILHLHSTQPTSYELSSDEENDQIPVEDDVIEVTDTRKQVIELLDDEDSDDDIDIVDGPTVKRQRV
jgi:Ubiquitin family